MTAQELKVTNLVSNLDVAGLRALKTMVLVELKQRKADAVTAKNEAKVTREAKKTEKLAAKAQEAADREAKKQARIVALEAKLQALRAKKATLTSKVLRQMGGAA